MSVKTIDTAFEGNAEPAFKEVRLKEIVTDNCLGGNYQCVEDITPIPVIKMGNLGRGTITLGKIEYVSDGKILSDRDVLRKGDILFNTRNTLDLVGKVAMWRGELEYSVFNSNIMRIVFSSNVLNEYMNYYFNSYSALKQLRARATGTTSVAAIYWRDCQNIKIKLPPLPEQKAIADLLSTWDKAIEKTEWLIQAKEKRFKWLLRELISESQNTQKDTKWKKVKIGSFLTESRISGNNGLEAQKITVKLYGKGVIPKGEKRIGSETTQYYVRKAGQFIYSKLDFLNGAFGIIPNDLDGFESTQDLPAFDISDAVLKEWFLYYLIRPEYYNRQLGLARGQRKARRVNPTEFLNSKIRLPPVEEQKAIAEILSICQHEIDLLKQLAEKYKTQKRSLMQKMLTGEWRVKPKIVNQYREASI